MQALTRLKADMLSSVHIFGELSGGSGKLDLLMELIPEAIANDTEYWFLAIHFNAKRLLKMSSRI